MTGVIDEDTDSVEQPVKLLLVDNVQLLAPEEAEALKPIFSKMFYFAALAGQVSRKRESMSLGAPKRTWPKLRHAESWAAAQQDHRSQIIRLRLRLEH